MQDTIDRYERRITELEADRVDAYAELRTEVRQMQKVSTGIADSTYIEIKSGIRPGDEVVSGSYTVVSRRLKDGSKVEIEKPAGKG